MAANNLIVVFVGCVQSSMLINLADVFAEVVSFARSCVLAGSVCRRLCINLIPWSCILGESEFRESMAKLLREAHLLWSKRITFHAFLQNIPVVQIDRFHSKLTFESTMTGEGSPGEECEDVERAGHKVKYSLAQDHPIEDIQRWRQVCLVPGAVTITIVVVWYEQGSPNRR